MAFRLLGPSLSSLSSLSSSFPLSPLSRSSTVSLSRSLYHSRSGLSALSHSSLLSLGRVNENHFGERKSINPLVQTKKERETERSFFERRESLSFDSLSFQRRWYGIPSNMGLDHVGFVVPNAQEAADFLIDVFNAEFDWEVKRELKPTFGEREWDKLFQVDPDISMPHVIMLKCGDDQLTQYVELFEFCRVKENGGEGERVDQRGEWPLFSDPANSYISFTVKDLDGVMKHVKESVVKKYPTVRFIQDPPMSFPLRGEVCRSTFLVSPWGMWIELTEWSNSRSLKPIVKSLQREIIERERRGEPRDVDKDTQVVDDNLKWIGCPIQEIPTPSFMIDLDAFENNAGAMSKRFGEAGVSWCPSGKGHKCPEILKKLQSEFGAQGVLALTLKEAYSFSMNGLDDIYIANQIVTPADVKSLSLLAKRTKRLRVNVDCKDNLKDIHEAVMQWEIASPVEVMVELNVGHNRCGVSPTEALEIAKLAYKFEVENQSIKFGGIAGYEGHTPILPPEKKTIETGNSHSVLSEARNLIEAEGIPVRVVSGGGSCNYPDCLKMGVLTEIQAGGGAISDLLYVNKAGLGAFGHQIGAHVVTTIVSASKGKDRAMGDAGFKSLGWHPFGGLPSCRDFPQLEVVGLSAEHTKILGREKEDGEREEVNLKAGEKVVLQVGYLDAMGFLHPRIFGVRNDVVSDVWDTIRE